MKSNFLPSRAIVCVLAITISTAAVSRLSAAPPQLSRFQPTSKVRLVPLESQIQGALQRQGEADAWKPSANREAARGVAARIFPQVAPAVVVVRTKFGHGTGFLIHPPGWIVTNQHVIADADVDPQTHVQVANIHLGRLAEGRMQLREEDLQADVYKTSEVQDLALLKLRRIPDKLTPVPALKLAEQDILPGADCVAIGHPMAAQLWTLRSGEIANIGRWPGDMIDVVMQRLSLASGDRADLDGLLSKAPQRKVLISTCGLNPGDSGGPLVNGRGEVIGVSFAVPVSDADRRVNLDKFSYHIHLAELTAFLENRPKQPRVFVPDAWALGVFSEIFDTTKDDVPDSWAFFLDKEQPPTGILVDIDQDSVTKTDDTTGLVRVEKADWDFEFALQRLPRARTFYDTENDGKIDLILTDLDDDGMADVEIRLVDGEWKAGKPAERSMLSAQHYQLPSLREAFGRFPFATP